MRKCSKCGGQVEEDLARRTYEEFFCILCPDCILKEGGQEGQDAAPDAEAAQDPQDQAPPEFTLYRQDPAGNIYIMPDGAALPPNAIFHGYIRKNKGGPSYQLFKFPPRLDPAALDSRAKSALEAGGFNFSN